MLSSTRATGTLWRGPDHQLRAATYNALQTAEMVVRLAERTVKTLSSVAEDEREPARTEAWKILDSTLRLVLGARQILQTAADRGEEVADLATHLHQLAARGQVNPRRLVQTVVELRESARFYAGLAERASRALKTAERAVDGLTRALSGQSLARPPIEVTRDLARAIQADLRTQQALQRWQN